MQADGAERIAGLVAAVHARFPGFRFQLRGVPDARTDEAVKLFVVRRDPALSGADIAALCASELTAYERPRQIVVAQTLPKSAVGRTLRRELREAA